LESPQPGPAFGGRIAVKGGNEVHEQFRHYSFSRVAAVDWLDSVWRSVRTVGRCQPSEDLLPEARQRPASARPGGLRAERGDANAASLATVASCRAPGPVRC